MSVLHDYLCGVCGAMFERMVEIDEKSIPCEMCGRGNAERVYRSAGGMLNKAKGRYPYYDVQLGRTVESPQHRDRVAKEQGLVTVSREEFTRSRNMAHQPDPYSAPISDKAIEKAKENWAKMESGNLPTPVLKAPDTQSDFLGVKTSETAVS